MKKKQLLPLRFHVEQTLKDFLNYGLNKLDAGEYKAEIENGEKYLANDSSDFSGAFFRTKKEAIEMHKDQQKDIKKALLELKAQLEKIAINDVKSGMCSTEDFRLYDLDYLFKDYDKEMLSSIKDETLKEFYTEKFESLINKQKAMKK